MGEAQGKVNSEQSESPERDDGRIADKNLPTGVTAAWLDSSMMRLIAEQHNQGMIHEPVPIKPWVLLELLDAYDAICEMSKLDREPSK